MRTWTADRVVKCPGRPEGCEDMEARSKLVGKRDLLVLFFFLSVVGSAFCYFFPCPFLPSADLAVLDCVMCSVGGILGKSTTRTSILSKGYCSYQCSSTYVSGTVPVGTYLGIPRHHLACVRVTVRGCEVPICSCQHKNGIFRVSEAGSLSHPKVVGIFMNSCLEYRDPKIGDNIAQYPA